MNKYNVIYIIKYYCIDAISIFNNPGAISSSLSQIGKNMMGTVSHKSHNNLLNNTTLCANWSLPWGVLRS